MNGFRRGGIISGLVTGLLLLAAGPAGAVDEPIIKDGRLIYPDGAEIPRYETETERQYAKEYGLPPSLRAATPPPGGPVHCVAEYEPMEGVLIAWRAFTTLLSQMTQRLTTNGAIVYVVVNSALEQNSANNTLTAGGSNMANVRFVVRTLDTVWIRDYGPRYVYEGACRAIVDHKYNRPTRLNDDAFPPYFGTLKKHTYYEYQNMYGNQQLIHGGGNYHLDALGRGYATRLINNENPTLTEPQIVDIWSRYISVNTALQTPFPTSVDATQHIDMWMQIAGDNKVIISDWPYNAGSTQDNICDGAAAAMAAAGYTVHRVPARNLSGVHYTFTNVVICNNVVLVPLYTNTNITNAPEQVPGQGPVNLNTQAFNAWAAAMPGYTLYQLNCDAIVPSAGVMHCVVMHLPRNSGGVNPTAYLRVPRGGEVFTPGSQVNVQWISDDDLATTTADVRLSLNGGATYDTVLAAGIADNGSYLWTVPNTCTSRARIRVVVRDASGNTGFDSSPADFRIPAQPCPGDLNCDGFVNPADAPAMALALVNPTAYAAAHPGCPSANGDLNGDQVLNGGDVQDFVEAINGP